jgi:pSer/pThr/pTyr-binding forkhead associated (FHA) protein
MPDLRLHFSNQQQPDVALDPGVHRLVRQANGRLGLGDAAQGALLAQFCMDRRGLWLQVANGARGIHVNGRPVQRMAMLRAGDAVYADGVELVVQAERVAANMEMEPGDQAQDPRVLLRGVGGQHHGRSFTLSVPRLVGSAREADIRIDDPSFPARHARLERRGQWVVLKPLGAGEGSLVNGIPVREAVLRAGDQVVFDGRHRFVVEFPGSGPSAGFEPLRGEPEPVAEVSGPVPARGVRAPWLLLAALLLGAGLSALLWFGAR